LVPIASLNAQKDLLKLVLWDAKNQLMSAMLSNRLASPIKRCNYQSATLNALKIRSAWDLSAGLTVHQKLPRAWESSVWKKAKNVPLISLLSTPRYKVWSSQLWKNSRLRVLLTSDR